MPNQSNEHASDGNRSLIEIDLENASDGSEYANVESYLSNLHGIEAVHLDRTRGVAHLIYDASVITAEPMAISDSFKKKDGMGFWTDELGATAVVALKNTLKRSGLAVWKITLVDRWAAQSRTSGRPKLLSLMANGDFCFALITLLV